jgi:hypothetical protein
VTLRDLRTLCNRYVPEESRHPNSWPPFVDDWWPAHELGHLLTADLDKIGQPLFGMDDDQVPDDAVEHELRCRELAAMSISGRLLTASGRGDLASQEREDTDTTTMYWDDRGRVDEILRAFRCVRLPRTRARLERKLQLVIQRAKLGGDR